MTTEVRHPFRLGAAIPGRQWCGRCEKGRTNLIHRINGRCTVCLRIFRNYELDSSRRCDACRP